MRSRVRRIFFFILDARADLGASGDVGPSVENVVRPGCRDPSGPASGVRYSGVGRTSVTHSAGGASRRHTSSRFIKWDEKAGVLLLLGVMRTMAGSRNPNQIKGAVNRVDSLPPHGLLPDLYARRSGGTRSSPPLCSSLPGARPERSQWGVRVRQGRLRDTRSESLSRAFRNPCCITLLASFQERS